MKKILKAFISKKFITIVCCLSILLTLSGCTKSTSNDTKSETSTKTLTDMGNRTVTLPTEVNKISVIHPIPCQMVWRLAPNKLVSINNQFTQRIEFMSAEEQKKLLALPVNGGFDDLNNEDLLAVNPDVVVSLTKDTKVEDRQSAVNIPYYVVSKDTLSDIANSWRSIGKLVGNEKEGNEIGDYWDETVKKVTDQTSKIPDSKKLKVYYAQSDVVSTVGSKTIMSSIIKSAGGISFMNSNPALDKNNETSEGIKLSMEQIYAWNPDVIITQTKAGSDEIMSSSAWKDINAVKNKRVYPSTKYAMLDRTQSLMGLLWTTEKLYPGTLGIDVNSEIRKFYSKVYLDDNVTDEQLNATM